MKEENTKQEEPKELLCPKAGTATSSPFNLTMFPVFQVVGVLGETLLTLVSTIAVGEWC
jgi:hypothetical protein